MSKATIAARRQARRKRYAQNIHAERVDSKRRAQTRRQRSTAAELEVFLERHREAQARYREKHRTALAFKAREYRRRKAIERERERDAELLQEFEHLMEIHGDAATFEEAAKRLRERTGKRYKV